MSPSRNTIIAALFGWLAVCLQLAVAPRLQIWGAYPDFQLIALAAFCPIFSRVQGGVYGFFLGLGYGGCIGANLWQWSVAYSLTGFVLAWINDHRVTPTFPVLMATGFFGTVSARIILMFVAAPPGIGGYLGATILSALYNGVLVLPLYALLKRFIDPVLR